MAGHIAFCVTMLFLTGTDPRVKKWPLWMFIILHALVNIAQVAIFYTQCGTELDIYWVPAKHDLDPTHCWDLTIQTQFGYFVGAFNSLTDFYLTILPAVLIEHTILSLEQKVGLTFLLCLSIDALAASTVKTYAMKALSELLDFTCTFN